ncbi:disheveled-associated activator of morphogenesis 2 isoform X3 [Hydra vulgaris]|uniref:Disheveled-associated activator of morphogenesis 2 isoform X3 n=1 Tax=Hydra vulgaris TaxID=6087 RepID=A0ABM4CHR6_HYDVU
MPFKRPRSGLFSCFSSSDLQPDITIRYEPEGAGAFALQSFNITPMPDIAELNSKFSELVDELDLTAVCKEAMFDLPPEKKWQIYCSRFKQGSNESSVSPDHYLKKLHALNSLYYQRSDEEIKARTKFLDELKTALRTQPMSFVLWFLNNEGLQCLVDILANMDWETCESTIHTACIGCLKALMNNSNGRSEVLAHPNCINIIAQSLITENLKTKTAVLEILGACCLVPGGHKKVLDAMCHFQQYAEERSRFQSLINDLDRTSGLHKDEFASKIAIMSFINAALRYGAGAEHLEFRIHLRFEFLMLGLQPIMDKLRKLDNLTLDRHLDFFEMVQKEDEKELCKRYGSIKIDAKSANNMLGVLKQKIGHTTCYTHLLSIMQHLLLFPVDQTKEAFGYWRMLDRIVQEIALQQKDGSDPDVAPVDIHIAHIIERMNTDDFKDETVSKLAKRESELEEMKNTIEKMADRLEKESSSLEELKKKFEELLSQKDILEQQLNNEKIIKNKLESLVKDQSTLNDIAKISTISELPIPFYQPTSPTIVPDSKIVTPPPPPPPPPVFGEVPLAPPLLATTNITKKKSKLPKPSQPLKSFNWSKLSDIKLKNTIWEDIDENKVVPYLDFEEIDEMFSAYQKREKIEDEEDGTQNIFIHNKPKELSFIDNRRAQNCQILLKRINLSNDEIRMALIKMDPEEKLTKDILEQMLKFVPTQDEGILLQSHSKEAFKFALGDRYLYEMSRIVHFEERLKALCYKKTFTERISEIKPKIQCIVSACRQLSRSKRLCTLLEIILCLGNYMNKGSRSNASGFKVISLNKIIDTKSSLDKRITLLHYIVDLLSKKFPQVYNLEEELFDVKNAIKYNIPELNIDLKLLKNGFLDLQKELEFQINNKIKDENDNFISVITSFLKFCNFSLKEVEVMYSEMDAKLNMTIAHFGEDAKSLSSDEFFNIFYSFLVSFEEVKSENIIFKKEKNDSRKANVEEKGNRRTSSSKLLLFKNSNDRRSLSERSPGEFDDLISALRTGDVFGDDISVFNKHRKRKQKLAHTNGK